MFAQFREGFRSLETSSQVLRRYGHSQSSIDDESLWIENDAPLTSKFFYEKSIRYLIFFKTLYTMALEPKLL